MCRCRCISILLFLTFLDPYVFGGSLLNFVNLHLFSLFNLRILTVCLDGYDRTAQTGRLQAQTFICWQFWRLEVQDPRPCRAGVRWGFSSCLSDSCPLPTSVQRRAPPYDLTWPEAPLKRPCLQTQSQWMFGFLHMHLGGHDSVHDTCLCNLPEKGGHLSCSFPLSDCTDRMPLTVFSISRLLLFLYWDCIWRLQWDSGLICVCVRLWGGAVWWHQETHSVWQPLFL